jgi:hypothetical protein
MLCSKCRERERREGQRWCQLCHNAYVREHRPKHSELSEEERAKAVTRAYTNTLIARGAIQRQPCACGSLRAEAHHPDYTNPRLIVWLCRRCHRKHHDAQRSA